MKNYDYYLEQELYKSINKAYEWLYDSGKNLGNWKDVCSTSIVGIALAVREPENSPWIISAKEWILNQQVEVEPDVACWGEDLSATSIAIIALLRLGVSPNEPKIKKALNFIHKKFNTNGKLNWYDEPWETSWSIFAIAESGRRDFLEDAYNGIDWLISLQDADGRIVASHYSAYIIKIINALQKRQLVKEIDQIGYDETVFDASKYLIDILTEEKLWTGESWSNGHILWALTSTDNFPYDDQKMISTIVNWFVRNQEAKGNWGSSECTGFAIKGLVSLLTGYKLYNMKDKSDTADIDTIIFNNLRRLYKTPKLAIGKRFIETHEDGSISLNFSPRLKKATLILLAIAGVLLTVVGMWDLIMRILGF